MTDTATAYGAAAVERRECLLGGETRRRGLFGGGMTMKEMGAWVAYGLVGVVLELITQSVVVLLVIAAVPLLAWLASRRLTGEGDSWVGAYRDYRVGRSARSTYQPVVADDGLTVLPSEVGRVDFIGVSAEAGRPELGIIRHGGAYFSAVLEISGGGDGLMEQVAIDRTGIRFGRFLYAVSRADLPVDQIDMSTRVVPVDPGLYERWVETHHAPSAPPVLTDNLRQLASDAEGSGEAYRTFMTVCMPISQLAARARRHGRVDAEALANAAYRAVGRVAKEAARQGFTGVQGLTPARLGALIRHQYDPSYLVDDLSDLSSPREAWPAYRSHRDALEVPGLGGEAWWHATASVPKDGWPLRPVGVRWLEDLVSGVTPPVIRTVQVQHRLQSKVKTRAAATLANTLDTADVMSQDKRGATSTGEREAQEKGSALLLHDLLYEAASGDMPQLRVTVSARSEAELVTAREQIEGAMQDCDINRIRWHEHRHHHGHLLTLPIGRGIKR